MRMLDGTTDFPTVDEYRRAFETVQDVMTVRQLLLLQRHYYSQGRTSTARKLAEAVGFRGHQGFNSQYGDLAKKVCNALGVKVNTDNVFILATFVHDPDMDQGECQFTMRVQVARALELLKWVW